MKNKDSYFEIAKLINRLLEGKLDEEEALSLKKWIDESKENRQLWEKLTNESYLEEKLQYWEENDGEVQWQSLRKVLKNPSHQKKIPFWKKALKYAAIILPLVVLATLGWYLLNHKKSETPALAGTMDLDAVHILPKGKVAKLVLGNGKAIALDGSKTQEVTERDGTKVKNKKNTLSYLISQKKYSKDIIYNTLITPKGGEYKVVLSDGTKVWLNAASSLKYPTRFSKDSREVVLTGEAYFEVAENKHQPFLVKTKDMGIAVLGTSFNVSAYENDEKQVVTLVNGKVKVSDNQKTDVILHPGYKAIVSNEKEKIAVDKASLNETLAWKNGLFLFKSESLGQIMKTLSRWYDVKVDYAAGIDTLLHFTGRIQKYENISGILKRLEMTKKISFRIIENKKVEVIPWEKEKILNKDKEKE